FLADYPPSGSSAIRQIRTGGVNTPIFGAAAFDGNYWHSAVPHLSNLYNPTMASIFGDDPNPAINRVFRVYKQVAGSPPATSVYPMIGYLAIQLFARAATKAHSTDSKAVAAALDTFHNEPFLAGPVTVTKT